MWKFIKRWYRQYNDAHQYMADQGLFITHTPFGVVHYVDDKVIERLNSIDDRSKPIRKKDK